MNILRILRSAPLNLSSQIQEKLDYIKTFFENDPKLEDKQLNL